MADFFTYIAYKKCFDWAYEDITVEDGELDCNIFITSEGNRFKTADGKSFCVK